VVVDRTGDTTIGQTLLVLLYAIVIAGGVLTLAVGVDPATAPTIDPVGVRRLLILAGALEVFVGLCGLWTFRRMG